MPTGYFSGDPEPLANGIEGCSSSTGSSLETAPPLHEPSARSARRLRRQTAAEAAATAAVVASVATPAHVPSTAVADVGASASGPRSVVGTAVARTPTAVQLYMSLPPLLRP